MLKIPANPNHSMILVAFSLVLRFRHIHIEFYISYKAQSFNHKQNISLKLRDEAF